MKTLRMFFGTLCAIILLPLMGCGDPVAVATLAQDSQKCTLAVATGLLSAPPGTTDAQKAAMSLTIAASTPACESIPADTILAATKKQGPVTGSDLLPPPKTPQS